MDFYINIALFITALINLAVVVKRDMHMLQQNSYRNERYLKWFRNNSEYLSINRLIDLCILVLMLSIFSFDSWYIRLIIIIILIIKSCVELRKKFKKPLVFTKRVIRLFSFEFKLLFKIGRAHV